MQLCVLYHFLFPCACIEQIAYLLRRTCGGKSSVSVIGIDAAVININEHKIRLDTVIKADRVIGLARHDVFAVRIFCRRKQCAELFQLSPPRQQLLFSHSEPEYMLFCHH